MGRLQKLVAAFLLLVSYGLGASGPRSEMIVPLPPPPDIDPLVVELGMRLFHDPRLSSDMTVSCASCHHLNTNGADTRPVSLGVGGAPGNIRTPTVYNATLNHRQFWDGRAATLEEQVDGPVHNPVEMNTDWPNVIERLSQDRHFVTLFRQAYPDGLTAENLRAALADFQRTLITLNSPFDRWLRGDDSALTSEQVRGFYLFREYGCISCHQGANVGGNMFARMGSLENYFLNKGEAISQVDQGRYGVTGNPEHLHVFKVPSLRLAATNHYFFHDASDDSLEDAIRTMARFQLGRQIPDGDVYLIAQFLVSLVGEHPLMQGGSPADE